MRNWLQRLMYGRYGTDQLNRFLLVLTLIFLVLSMFTSGIFYWLSLIGMVLLYFRMFSRNTYKRAAENEAYLRITDRIRGFFTRSGKGGGRSGAGRNTDAMHRVFPCPSCRQKIRVPKGKGKIAIRCPKCGAEFVKRT